MKRLSHVIAPVLVGTALASLAVVATVNYVVTADLDEGRSIEQLEDLQRSRVHAISDGLERSRRSVALLADDPAVVEALIDLRDGVAEIEDAVATGDGLLDDGEEAELRGRYEGIHREAVTAGLDVPGVDELVPTDPVGRRLQLEFMRNGPTPGPDGGPTGAYRAARQRHAPVLRQLSEQLGFADLLLIDLDDRIVHTVAGGPELGVDAMTSVFGRRGLADLLRDELRRTAVGEVALVDVHSALGDAGRPAALMAVAARDDREVVGVVVVRLDVDRLNQLMTAGGQWRDAGLGDTGETFVVGRDLLLRTDARGYLEDPEAYLRALRDAGEHESADAIEARGSTVLAERIDTRPVRAALDGRTFAGRADDATGVDVLAVASPLDMAGVDWVVVAEIARSEAMVETSGQRRDLLLLAAIVLPIVGLVGLTLAWRLVRPVGPLVDAAERLAATERDVDLDDASRDEFGHLARELGQYALALRTHDAELAEERRALDHLLEAVLPGRAVEAVRSGAVELGDLVDTATVVAVTIVGTGTILGAGDTSPDIGDTTAEQHREVASELERLAAAHGAERIWAAGDRHLYLTGLGRPDAGRDDAVRFALSARSTIAGGGDAGVDDAGVGDHGGGDDGGGGVDGVGVHVGMATGTVATGVVGGEHVAFGVWGEPVRVALALDAVAAAGEVLATRDLVERLVRPVTLADERDITLGPDTIAAVAVA